MQFFHGVRREMLPTLAWLETIASVLGNRRADSIDQLEPAGQHATCIGQRRNALTHDVQAGHLAATIEPLQAISPTCPMSGFSRSYCAAQSQSASSQGQRHRGVQRECPHWHLKDPTQTHQDVTIMCCCEVQSQIDRAKPFATNSWPWWQRKRTRGAKQTARHAPEVCVPRASGVPSPYSSTSP